jgi:hypothetical protein
MITDALSGIAAGVPGKTVLSQAETSRWCQNIAADYAVFSYRRDFVFLWGLDAGELAGIALGLALSRGSELRREYTLIVVWDGIPEKGDEIAIDRHVTPYEWAVALTLALYDKRMAGRPRLRFLIFDTNPRERSFIERSLFAVHNVIPWIQGYYVCEAGTEWLAEAALTEDDSDVLAQLRQAVPPDRHGPDCLMQDIVRPNRILTTFDTEDDGGRLGQLQVLRDLWRQELVKPGGRHAVANLMGPYVLANGLSKALRPDARTLIERASVSRQALAVVVAEIGLLRRSSDDDAPAVSIGFAGDGGPFSRRRGIRFLLIDDRYNLGYQHILGFVLFGRSYDGAKNDNVDGRWRYTESDIAELRCVDSAEQLLEILERSPAVSNWALPRSLTIPDCDVLLLDLRLWRDDEGLRRDFFANLVRICRKVGAEALRSDRFRTSFREAQKLADGKPANEILALPLLALLVSHYDASLPIVLFSSTHQREAMDLMAERPNIVTSFAKPLLMGYGEEQRPTEVARTLFDSLRRAVDLHEARVLWERIETVEWGTSPAFKLDRARGKGSTPTSETFNAASASRSFSPRHRGGKLREALALLYVEYIQSARWIDFATQPWEFLEGGLPPVSVRRGLENPGFDLVYENTGPDGRAIQDAERRRNILARSLKRMRHRKAHGHVIPPTATDTLGWRHASLLQFQVLLDYIRGEIQAGPPDRDQLRKNRDDYWNRRRHGWQGVLGHWAGSAKCPHLSLLASIDEFPWLDFALLATADGAIDSFDAGGSVASRDTTNALMRLMA